MTTFISALIMAMVSMGSVSEPIKGEMCIFEEKNLICPAVITLKK